MGQWLERKCLNLEAIDFVCVMAQLYQVFRCLFFASLLLGQNRASGGDGWMDRQTLDSPSHLCLSKWSFVFQEPLWGVVTKQVGMGTGQGN